MHRQADALGNMFLLAIKYADTMEVRARPCSAGSGHIFRWSPLSDSGSSVQQWQTFFVCVAHLVSNVTFRQILNPLSFGSCCKNQFFDVSNWVRRDLVLDSWCFCCDPGSVRDPGA